MKKKFILVLLLCLLYIPIVNAATVKTANIKDSTYIIGKYLFTRDSNENYDGVLTTKRIMLASKSIDSSKESDMMIYYKNAKGNWIDAITGESLENVAENFIIQYVDLRNIDDNAYTATLLEGQAFNAKIKALAGNGTATYETIDNNITAIAKANALPELEMTEDNIISAETSENAVYAWFVDGTLYYYVDSYTGDSKIYLSANSSNMFDNLNALTTLDLSNFDFSKVTLATNMFANMNALTKMITPEVNANIDIALSMLMLDEDSNLYEKLPTTIANKTELNKGYYVTFLGDNNAEFAKIGVLGKTVVTAPAENPTKDGYTFDKWQLNGTDYDFSTLITSNITLTATWKIKKFVVTFKVDGTNYSEEVVEYNDKVEKPATDPTKEGYVFDKWLLDGVEFDFNTAIKGYTVLTAGWIKTHVVTFDSDGGTNIDPVEVLNGSKVSIPEIPNKTGYTFDKWYLLDEQYDFDSEVTAPITLKAKWIANDYTITLNNGEANVAGTTTLYEKYNTGWYTNLEAEPVTAIAMPEKEGFTFGGYYTETEGSGTLIVNDEGNIVGSNTTFTTNTTIYAKWNEKTAALTYDANNCGTAPSNVMMKYTTATNAESSMTMAEDWELTGWNTEADGSGTPYAKGATVNETNVVPSAITLYAQCQKETTRTITYDGNEITGGSTTASTCTAYAYNGSNIYGSCTVSLSSNGFSKTGYDFSKWAAGSTSGTQYEVGSEVSISADVTYYAIWVANDYTITLNNGEANVAGTTTLYEKYNTGWYTNLEAEPVTAITIPEKEGFTFGGYCTETEGSGTLIINGEGNIVGSNTAFTTSTTIYANWISE